MSRKRVRKTCTTCGQRFQVYRNGVHDVQFFICKYCREGLEQLTNHKPYVQSIKPKGEFL